jgi:hypothetical protein
VFAHHEEEDEIYPLTTIEISGAQHKDQEPKVYFKKNTKMPQKDVCFQFIEDTKVLCKNGKLIIPASLFTGQSVGKGNIYRKHLGGGHYF